MTRTSHDRDIPDVSPADARVLDRMRRLAQTLTSENVLADPTFHDPRWRRAFFRAPRHLFVPAGIWVRHTGGDGFLAIDRDEHVDDEAFWWDAVYQDYLIVTQVDDGRPHRVGMVGDRPSCAISQPSYVFMMLGQLDVCDGIRVLEIGAGTGWTAALLAARLGDRQVTTVEIDPVLAARARASLAAAGLAPTLVVKDGALGHQPGAPYDRISSTVAVRHVPPAWPRQARPGGVIVTPWRAGYDRGGGTLRLVVDEDGCASGPFVADGPFMEFRAHRFAGDPDRRATAAERAAAERAPGVADRHAQVDPDMLRAGHDLTFAIGVQVSAVQHARIDDEDGRGHQVVLADDRGSWARARVRDGAGPWQVRQGGPRRLWDEVEAAHAWWVAAGRPDRRRFGLTVTPAGQHTWFDNPRTGPRWPVLPPA